MTFVVTITCEKGLKRFAGIKDAISARVQQGATVAKLRDVLWPDIPDKAYVYAERPTPAYEWMQEKGLIELDELDELPRRVTISEFTGKHSFYALLVDDECMCVMQCLRAYFKTPEVQQRLDALQASSGENEGLYRAEMGGLLYSEVYPQHVIPYITGISDGASGGGTEAVMFGMQMNERRFLLPLEEREDGLWNRVYLLALWFDVQSLMRYGVEGVVKWSEHVLGQWRAIHGPLSLEDLIAFMRHKEDSGA